MRFVSTKRKKKAKIYTARFLDQKCTQVKNMNISDPKISVSPRRNAHFHIFFQKKLKWFYWFLPVRCGRCWCKVDIFTKSQISIFGDLFSVGWLMNPSRSDFGDPKKWALDCKHGLQKLAGESKNIGIAQKNGSIPEPGPFIEA